MISVQQSMIVLALAVVLQGLLQLTTAFPIKHQLLEEIEEELNGLDEATRLAHSHARFIRMQRHHKRKAAALKEAMVYLRQFGYMQPGEPLTPVHVANGLKAFQEMAGLHGTGHIDAKTIKAMREPRCGNSDIPLKANHNDIEANIRTRQKRFARDRLSKWAEKIDNNDVLRLTWFIQKYTTHIKDREEIRNVVKRAFKLWANQIDIPSLRTIKLQFSEAPDSESADINILWAKGDHGDMYPFDDGGSNRSENILAHTFYPNYSLTLTLNGDIHLDDYENWVTTTDTNSKKRTVYFPYVLVHEIGHALGLGHSKSPGAVMNAIYKSDTPLDRVTLDLDDRCAINWNYVGVSNTCLQVFLMIEMLPGSSGPSNEVPGLSSSIIDNIHSDDFQEQNVESDQQLNKRINATLAALLNTSIPSCRETNDVQVQYEILLENNLQFPKNSAKQHGPVVCNFLDGLANLVELKTGSRVQRTDEVPLVSAHAYSHRYVTITDGDDDFNQPSRVRRSTDTFSMEDLEQLLVTVSKYHSVV